MFARGLSGRHNTLTVVSPTDCVLPPLSARPRPPLWYFRPMDGKEGHPALVLAVGASEVSARFQWPVTAAAGQTLPEGNPQHVPDTTLIIITSRHLPGLFCTG